MAEPTWHVITGEYPPATGGVAAYAAQLARGLVADGRAVRVWCPARGDTAADSATDPGATVHRIRDGFTPRGVRALARRLDGCPEPRVLLLHYTPNALGLRGLNLPFCLWLWRRARRDDVRVLFHEPYFYFGWRRPWRNGLAIVQRLMAVALLAASRVVYVSSPSWRPLLDPYAWAGRRPTRWLPIASAVEPVVAPARVDLVRRALTDGRSRGQVVGHFGTYGDLIRPLLRRVAIRLARRPDVTVLCLGSTGDRFRAALVAARPELAGRVVAPGHLAEADLSIHLQACDLAVQPFPDGVTTRRTSVMAPLSHGVPVVTSDGPYTEPIWRDPPAGVALVPVGDHRGLAGTARRLLDDAPARRDLGARGQALYRARFAVPHAVAILTEASDGLPRFDTAVESNAR